MISQLIIPDLPPVIQNTQGKKNLWKHQEAREWLKKATADQVDWDMSLEPLKKDPFSMSWSAPLRLTYLFTVGTRAEKGNDWIANRDLDNLVAGCKPWLDLWMKHMALDDVQICHIDARKVYQKNAKRTLLILERMG